MEAQENVLDLNKICRLCLMEESVMSSIYSDTDKHSSAAPLPLRIMACVSIELNSLDGLPSQICTTCLCQVDGWYKFKDMCETADEVLRKCVKNEPVELETITEIRSRAKEVRQFFASPHLIKVEGLNSALSQNTTSKKSLESAVKKEDMVSLSQNYLLYLNPSMYFKWLQTKYNLNDNIQVKKVEKDAESCLGEVPDYEIVFNSQINTPEKEINCERVVMEMGECQLVQIYKTENEDISAVDVGECASIKPKKFKYKNHVVETAVANYEKTKEYLENAMRERGNTHEEVIENVLYTFRLDSDGKLDVVNIIEGVTEPHPQRGFRYTCLFCSKIVVNKLVYDKHIREDHLDYLVCKVCDKQLYSLRNFLIHIKTHLGVYTFTCPLCGKGLTRASIFKSHMMYHYYGKVQKCQICEKKFRDIFALRRHVQLHDKKIEYVCELCGFGTHLKSNLEYHVRAHADERSYMCELCGKQFTAPQSLHHHMKTHLPNFPCPHCKRVFRHENKFKNHLEQSHGEMYKDNNKDEEEEEEFEEEHMEEEFEILKEKKNEDGGRLNSNSLIKTKSKKIKEELSDLSEEESLENEAKEENLIQNGSPEGEAESSLDEEPLTNRMKLISDSENVSLEDDAAACGKKKKVLNENNKVKVKTKKKLTVKKGTAVIKCLRTVQIQAGADDEDNFLVAETKEDNTDDSLSKKKSKSKKTQTLKEQSGSKKRFRIRPAIPSSCTLCDKVYKNSEILRQHMKSHHVSGTIECSTCKLTFTSVRSLKYHEQRKHSNIEPVPCSFCGKKFLDKKYLRTHENIHSQANHFVCQFCGRKFIMKTNLTVHISRHHTKKSNDFICQICGKAFPFKLYLKKHFKTHTDYKPYQCTYCEAKFRENTLLRKHINSIHLKLRPFLCQYCHKTFTRSLYLREHTEIQHLGIQRKVECSRCGEAFQNRNRLRQHECLGRMEVVRVE